MTDFPSLVGVDGPFDVIFCRNVVIYFDQDTREALFRRFADLLAPSGFLVLGHSENLNWLPELYEPAGQTIHRRRDGRRPQQPPAAIVTAAAPVAPAAPAPVVLRIDPGEIRASREPCELAFIRPDIHNRLNVRFLQPPVFLVPHDSYAP